MADRFVICPECSNELDTSKVSLIKHAIDHWGVQPNEISRLKNPEAEARYAILLAAAADGEE